MQLVLWQDSTIISLANYTHTWLLVSPARFRLSLLRSYKEKCSDKSSEDSVKRKSVYFAKVVLKQNDITLHFIATLSRIHSASLFLVHAVALKQFEIGNWVINIVTWIRLYCYNHRFRKMKAIVTKATFLSLCNHCHYHYEEWLNTSVNWKPRRFKQRMNFGTVLSILTAHECLVLKPVLYLYSNTWKFPFAWTYLFMVDRRHIFSSFLGLGNDINRMKNNFSIKSFP